MVFPSKSTEKTRPLKPCFTSIDGSEAVLPRQNCSASSPPDLKALALSVSFHGWSFKNTNFKAWARKMAYLHKSTWKKAGIFEAIVASTYRIHKNTDLVLGIAERWCPDTKTFIFPWGETTITLEDVMALLGLSVLGLPVFATLDSSEEKKKIQRNLEKEWVKIKTQASWMKRFVDCGGELEHVAFLALWLSHFVFPSRNYHVSESILPIAFNLSSGFRIALAPAVLAHLYAELSLLKTHIRDFTKSPVKIELCSLFKLVQLWTWERFKGLQPKPNPILKGEPRLVRWEDLRQESTSDVRQFLDNSKFDSFEWRPYTIAVRKWIFPKFYPEKAMRIPVGPNLDDEFVSYARCIKVSELVGIDCVEHYFPNRVASQFGILQDVPPSPINRKNLSKEEAWNDYNKPIDDLTLYIPSRSAPPCVTPTFSEWWRNSFPKFQSNQVSKSSFFPLGSKMKRRSKDGIKIAEDSTNKRRKYSDVKKSGGDDPSSLKKLLPTVGATGDETVLPPEIEDTNQETNGTGSKTGENMFRSSFDENNASDANRGVVVDIGVSKQTCKDEYDAYGSNAYMIDGDSTEPECLLQEDGKEDNVVADWRINESSPMVLSQTDESNIHVNVGITVGDGNQRQVDCLLHGKGLGTRKSSVSLQLSDTYAKSLSEVKAKIAKIQEHINNAQSNLAWLNERSAQNQ